MKKLFLVFAVAGSLMACDNSADAEQRIKDSLDSVTNLKKESIDEAAKDAKQGIDSTTEAIKDSVDAGVDSLNKAQ